MMPQEIQVWYVLPALRREIARCLVHEHGKSQAEAAELLGVTGAAISQYFKSKRASVLKFNNGMRSQVEAACSKVLEGESTMREELYKLSISEKVKESMCEVHQQVDDVPVNCNMCFK